jgi:hypothetical protein
MTDLTKILRELDESSHRQRWLNSRRQAAQFLDHIEAERFIAALAERWNTAHLSKTALPEADEALVDAGLPDDVLDAMRGLRGQSEHITLAMHMLTSKAAARMLAGTEPTFAALDAAAKVMEDPDWESLSTEFASCVKDRETWVALLTSLPTKLTAQGQGDDADLVSDEQDRWASERTSPYPHWRGGQTRIDERSGWFVGLVLLRALDPRRWIEVIGQLPIPHLIETVLWYAGIAEEDETLISLLAAAPSAFDATGSPTGAPVVYFLVTYAFDLGIRVLDRTLGSARVAPEGPGGDDARTRAKTIRDENLPAWFRTIGETVLSRTDGIDLAIEIAVEHVFRAQLGGTHSPAAQERSEQSRNLAKALINELAKRSVTLEKIRERWDRREAFAAARLAGGKPANDDSLHADALPYWLAATMLCDPQSVGDAGQPCPVREAEVLWTWMAILLERHDPCLRYTTLWGTASIPSWILNYAGWILASCTTPDDAWNRTWLQLAGQRDAGRMRVAAKDEWTGSQFLIGCGLYAVHHISGRKEPDRDVASARILRASLSSAILIWLYSGEHDGEGALLFSLAHLAKSKIEIQGEPAKSISYMVGTPDVALQAAWSLARNGMDLAEVDQHFRAEGIDLPAYASLLNSPLKESPDVVHLLADLETNRKGSVS